ncbi:hypothetical protein [Akkermansia sp.]|nr:hypothetical protein [Akkermansia sp.]
MNHHPHLSETAKRGLRALHRAVKKEMEKKSRLGQYVIVFRNGKTVRMLASEALQASTPAQNPGETAPP